MNSPAPMLRLNLPNFLCFFRMFLSPVFVVVALLGYWKEAFALFCLAAFTDLIDGAIARLFHQKTKLGAFIDPVADKILMACGFVTLTIVGVVPFWLTLIVFSRDLMISGGVLYLRWKKVNLEYRPTVLSKVTTLFQMLTLTSALAPLGLKYYGASESTIAFFREPFPYLIASTLIFTVITGVQYYEIGAKIYADSFGEKLNLF